MRGYVINVRVKRCLEWNGGFSVEWSGATRTPKGKDELLSPKSYKGVELEICFR